MSKKPKPPVMNEQLKQSIEEQFMYIVEVDAVEKALQEGKYSNRYSLEGKIKKLEQKLKTEQQKAYWQQHLAR